MSKRGQVIAVVVLLVVLGTGYWLSQRGSSDREYATATLGAIDVTIETVGALQAAGAQSARSDVAGVIASMGVDAGDVVDKGDIVAVLEREPFDNAVEVASERVVDAEYGLQFAEQRAKDEEEGSELRSDVLEAAERVQDAREALEDARANLAQSVILAPVSGTVLEVQLRAGDGVGVKQSVVRIASPVDLQLIADIDELDLPNIDIGAEARFRLDSYPANEITGTVESTAPQARQQGGATVFATTINFDVPEDLDIRPGMNADVTIVTDERNDVLLIPERALTTVGDRVFVDVLVGDELEEREITLGYRGNAQVEVVDGLLDGDRVLLH